MTNKEVKELRGRLIAFVSRKFFIAMLILVVSSLFVHWGYIDGTQWFVVATADILGYDFSNALAKRKKSEG